MAKHSTTTDQGVPSFCYNPATEDYPFLFELSRPLDDLEEMLLSYFSGQQISLEDIYANHSVGKPYVLKNYRDVLRRLEEHKRIKVDPPAEKRRMNRGERTFSENAIVTFPEKS